MIPIKTETIQQTYHPFPSEQMAVCERHCRNTLLAKFAVRFILHSVEIRREEKKLLNTVLSDQ